MDEPELHPVVQAPWWEGTPPWPWPVADLPPFSFLRLSGEMDDAEIGSVMASLLPITNDERDWSLAAVASELLEDGGLILSGGLEASQGERVISPGCCCGLENWREWLATGQDVWLGHDPNTWVEWGDPVRVWSGPGNSPPVFAIEFTPERLAVELANVQRDLEGFVARVGAWASGVGFPDPAALCRLLDASFAVTGART